MMLFLSFSVSAFGADYPMQGRLQVLIPVYNAEKTVRRAIDSARDFSLLIVNDGSDDGSEYAVLDAISGISSAQYSRYHNLGTLAARCRLILESTAEWLVFLDADDELNASALKQLDFAEMDGVDILFANYYDQLGTIKATSAENRFYRYKQGVSFFLELYFALGTHFFSFAGKIIRRSAFLRVAERYKDFGKILVSEDYLLLFAAILKGNLTVRGVDLNIYRVYNSPNSVTKRNPQMSYLKCKGDYLVQRETKILAAKYNVEYLQHRLVWWFQVPEYEVDCEQLHELLRLLIDGLSASQIPKRYNEFANALYDKLVYCWALGYFRYSSESAISISDVSFVIDYELEDEYDELALILDAFNAVYPRNERTAYANIPILYFYNCSCADSSNCMGCYAHKEQYDRLAALALGSCSHAPAVFGFSGAWTSRRVYHTIFLRLLNATVFDL